LKHTEFLDVCLDFKSGKYSPYRKPNDKLLYINAKSNHPATIKKKLLHMISKRISEISCNEETFTQAAPDYNQALCNSGCNDSIRYNPADKCAVNRASRKKARKRNATWFNLPCSVRQGNAMPRGLISHVALGKETQCHVV